MTRRIPGRRAFGLPRDLGHGLTLRFATRSDEEDLVEFNRVAHLEPDKPNEPFLVGVRRLLDGRHPTTRIGDFTVVVDRRRKGRIVSSLCVIPQTLAYDGIPFAVGRPELVGTDPDYRKKGLVRAQMEAIHRLGAGRGQLAQFITGIPWFYRLFGYEMALDLGAGRPLYFARPVSSKKVDHERLGWRRATVQDIPVLTSLQAAHDAASLVTVVRNDAVWRYELMGEDAGAAFTRSFRLVTDPDGKAIGYLAFRAWPDNLSVLEAGVEPGRSWREALLFAILRMKDEAARLEKPEDEKKRDRLYFVLGREHPVYEALGGKLEAPPRPYAWYVRLPDTRRFLRLVRPVLERRLAASALAGHTGKLRLNLVREHVRLDFEEGRLARIGRFATKRLEDGDAFFPQESFLRLLFGHRSIDELAEARTDAYATNEESRILLRILFPRRSSHLIGMM